MQWKLLGGGAVCIDDTLPSHEEMKKNAEYICS
jgi:hypothetical protein